MTSSSSVMSRLRSNGIGQSAVGAGSRSWECIACGLENADELNVCAICLRSRPMDTRGIPQVFKGLVIHFNGIIPRTLRHPSHAIEWRMAERHGARIEANFDPEVVTTLVYRPGYERSDKVRLCIEQYSMKIPCLPITWMLECMLQARRLHPNLFRLQFVPSVALPTSKGSVLPHHQHPFYVQNVAEYALFPSQLPENQHAALVAEKTAAALGGSSIKNRGAAAADASTGLPPPPQYDVPALKMAVIDVFDGAAAASETAQRRQTSGTFGGPPASPAAETTESPLNALFDASAASAQNRVLFRGLVIALSESLGARDAVIRSLRARGAQVVTLPGDFATTGDASGHPLFVASHATHFVYGHEDKKSTGTMLAARSVASGLAPSMRLAESTWLEDCVMLGELLPLAAPYIPTAKLLSTLQKKLEKAGIGSGLGTPATPGDV